MGPPPMSSSLEAACQVMNTLAVFPLTLEADSEGTSIGAVMQQQALRVRSQPPYSPERPPAEAMAMVDWIEWRWQTVTLPIGPEDPRVTVGGEGWPRMLFVLPTNRVRITYLVPEEAPSLRGVESEQARDTLATHIKLALRYLAGSLQAASRELGGREPPVIVILEYAHNPHHQADLERVPAEFRAALPSLIPVLNLDRRECDRRERDAHDRALRAVASEEQEFERLGSEGFTTQLALARVQDPHSGWR